MAEREWISKLEKIYRRANGDVYARPTIEGLGRKEIALDRKFEGDLSTLTDKLLRSFLAARDRKVAELIRSRKEPPAALYRFDRLASEVIESKKAKSSATFESAVIQFEKHLVPWANEKAPYLYEWEEKGETLWQQYIEDKRRDRTGIKLFNHKKHLGMLLLRAYERGIIKRRVKLYNPDPEIDVGQVLSPDQVKALYQAASLSLKTQIMMAFTMGLRKSEILRLEWNRVDFEKQELLFKKRNTKTRKARHVPMNAWVEDALKMRLRKRDGLWVFPSRYDKAQPQRSNKTAWGAAKRRAKVTARFHDLRHTFITNAVRAGMNPILICKYAGVSQEVMATVYCHLDTNDLRQVAGTVGGKLGEALR